MVTRSRGPCLSAILPASASSQGNEHLHHYAVWVGDSGDSGDSDNKIWAEQAPISHNATPIIVLWVRVAFPSVSTDIVSICLYEIETWGLSDFVATLKASGLAVNGESSSQTGTSTIENQSWDSRVFIVSKRRSRRKLSISEVCKARCPNQILVRPAQQKKDMKDSQLVTWFTCSRYMAKAEPLSYLLSCWAQFMGLDRSRSEQDHIYFIRIEDGFIVYDSALDFKAWFKTSQNARTICIRLFSVMDWFELILGCFNQRKLMFNRR